MLQSVNEGNNKEILVLMALGMIFVVVGHKGGINILSDWFPFYSFHMQLFMFIAGRLLKEQYANQVLVYVKRKVKHLILPYYVYNLVYCFIAYVCSKYCGFTFINKAQFSGLNSVFFKNFFIEPFYSGHQYIFNLASWFVPQLFLVQIITIAIIHFLNNKHKLINDILIVSTLFIGGVVTLYYVKTFALDQTLIRTIYLLPYFYLGYIYQKRIVKYDKLNSYYYFLSVFSIQAVLILMSKFFKYKAITTTVVFNHYYPGCILSFIIPLVGIAFWTRVARLLTPLLSKSKPFMYLGRNTWTVMMNHIFVFFLCNSIIYRVSKLVHLPVNFDVQKFHSDIWYYYPLIGGLTGLFYCIAGLVIPLLVKYYIENHMVFYKSWVLERIGCKRSID